LARGEIQAAAWASGHVAQGICLDAQRSSVRDRSRVRVKEVSWPSASVARRCNTATSTTTHAG